MVDDLRALGWVALFGVGWMVLGIVVILIAAGVRRLKCR